MLTTHLTSFNFIFFRGKKSPWKCVQIVNGTVENKPKKKFQMEKKGTNCWEPSSTELSIWIIVRISRACPDHFETPNVLLKFTCALRAFMCALTTIAWWSALCKSGKHSSLGCASLRISCEYFCWQIFLFNEEPWNESDILGCAKMVPRDRFEHQFRKTVQDQY